MTNKEFKAGDKVIPISKTVGDSIDKCKHYKNLQAGVVKFLYVSYISNGTYVCSSEKDAISGSYYNSKDLVPYKSNKKKKIKKLKNKVIKLKKENKELKTLLIEELKKPK